jgi:hypothetical protein
MARYPATLRRDEERMKIAIFKARLDELKEAGGAISDEDLYSVAKASMFVHMPEGFKPSTAIEEQIRIARFGVSDRERSKAFKNLLAMYAATKAPAQVGAQQTNVQINFGLNPPTTSECKTIELPDEDHA